MLVDGETCTVKKKTKKKRITICQYIDHFIALLFEMVYFRFCWYQTIVNLMALVEGIGCHHFFIHLVHGKKKKKKKRERFNLSKVRVGS